MVTASTLGRAHHFSGKSRLEVLHRGLVTLTNQFGWRLEAWAVFSNHYHFVAHSPVQEGTSKSLGTMLGLLHERTAKWINRLDQTPGRKIWHNYWETQLTYEGSYRARLNYVHQNAVKHGLVVAANQYPWCSASWFERTATGAQVRAIYQLRVDRLRVTDLPEVSADW
jgi:putative transposase